MNVASRGMPLPTAILCSLSACFASPHLPYFPRATALKALCLACRKKVMRLDGVPIYGTCNSSLPIAKHAVITRSPVQSLACRVPSFLTFIPESRHAWGAFGVPAVVGSVTLPLGPVCLALGATLGGLWMTENSCRRSQSNPLPALLPPFLAPLQSSFGATPNFMPHHLQQTVTLPGATTISRNPSPSVSPCLDHTKGFSPSKRLFPLNGPAWLPP